MADTDWTADELASLDRIPRYNILDPASGGDAYSFGGDGYIDNQMRQTVDALVVARGARRMALSASSAAILAAQEAASAKAERQAAQNAATDAYNSAQAAAGKVALAGAEADRAKAQADLAKGYAAGLKLPAVTPEMAGRFLKVNADGTAYELGEVTIATAKQITDGTGTGFVNAQTIGPILAEMRAVVGDVVDSLNTLSARSSAWMEATNQVLVRATYPQLFALIGTRYNDFGAIASGTIPASFYGSWSNGLTGVTYMPNGIIYALTNVYAQNTSNPKIFRSTDDGLNFSEMGGTSMGFVCPADVIQFKGGYIAPPVFTYDSQNQQTMASLYSTDGINWTKDTDGIIGSYFTMSYAYSTSYIVGVPGGYGNFYYKASYSGPWTQGNLPQGSYTGSRNSIVCLNNVFYYVSQQGNVYKTANPAASGGGWVSIFNHPNSQANTRSSIFAVLGNLYVIAFYGSTYTLYRITEANASTLLLSVDSNIQPSSRDVPNYLSSVQTDGKGRVLLFSGSVAFVLQPDGTTNRLNFNFSGYLTSEPVFLRRTDGLSLRVDGSTKTVVNRVKLAVADTDFQMPTITSPTPGMKRFIRAVP